MSSIESLADHLATAINRNAKNPSSVAVLKYGLITMINMTISIVIVLAISFITGSGNSALLAIIGFPVLRYVSGGLHLKSPALCSIVTACFMLLSIYMPIEYWYTGLVINIMAALVLLVYAPSGIKRSKIDPKHYPKLKWIAVGIVSANFIFQSHVLAMAYLVQSLTTTRLFQKVVDRYNL